LDHVNNIAELGTVAMFWTMLTTALIGGPHCAGMCGGLVLAAGPSKKENFSYQLGRLSGYLFLGLAAGSLSYYLKDLAQVGWVQALPTLTLALFFIYIGLTGYKGRAPHFPVPKTFTNLNLKLFPRALGLKKSSILRAYSIGMLSLFLPCGLLYGVALASSTLGHPLLSMGAMFVFWLGTLPALSLAPTLLQKFLNPMRQKYPKAISLCFVTIGLLTLASRFSHLYSSGGAACH
jgi:sulfite exporter TauE/SafE